MKDAQHDLLVLAAQAGEDKALSLLVRLHHKPLVRFAYRLTKNEAQAKDAVQNAWMTVAKKLRSLDDPRAFRAWIYQAVRWRALDIIKARGGIEPLGEHAEIAAETPPIDHHMQLDLQRAIGLLGPKEKHVVLLFYGEGLTVQETALVEGIKSGTVKSRLMRARTQLRQYLTGE